MFLCFALCSFIHINAQPISGPKFGIPMSEIRSAIGIDEKVDFALVYKGDTLASCVSKGSSALYSLFDEKIEITNYVDSLGYKYSLPQKSGICRISLPDSLPVYSYSNMKESNRSSIVRYDRVGKEEYKEEIEGNKKVVTRTLEKGKETTTVHKDRWWVEYTQSELDSSYRKSYDLDSVLVEWSYVVNRSNGERIMVDQRESPYFYTWSKKYYDTDTNYYYSLRVGPEKDTVLNESFTRKFKDTDSTYFCRDWSESGYVAHHEQYLTPELDSTYTIQSLDGIYVSLHKLTDGRKVSKSFDLLGNLTYRNSMEMVNGDYGVEEILEKRDTFYHVINYYHQLYWDKDHITDFFPYYQQVYLDEDSVVIRVLDYSFEKQDDWPVLTITEGDSSWVESTDEGGGSKYAAGVAFCGGAISRGVGLIIEEDPFRTEGAVKSKTGKQLEEVIRGCAKYEIELSGPPFYFFYSEGQEKIISSFKRLSTSCSSEVDRILRRGKKQKVTLYEKGTEREMECVFFKLDFNYRFGVIEKAQKR